ncbi:hypothetical protein [Pseudomonas sp. HR96]|uniref:hypothetical protein n=1 Tax=Pseudomonas sp. HR96 TaxID=1027966 RepID=UPI0039BE90EA
MLHIVDAELVEGNYVLYQGDLSTDCYWNSSRTSGAESAFMAAGRKLGENDRASRPRVSGPS